MLSARMQKGLPKPRWRHSKTIAATKAAAAAAGRRRQNTRAAPDTDQLKAAAARRAEQQRREKQRQQRRHANGLSLRNGKSPYKYDQGQQKPMFVDEDHTAAPALLKHPTPEEMRNKPSSAPVRKRGRRQARHAAGPPASKKLRGINVNGNMNSNDSNR